jgi:hypothetical protein
MSGASAHKSRIQRQARRLATDLAKGRMPASTVDLEDYLDRFPDDVFVALDGFVEQVASSGAGDAIALGYLYLIQGQLERVRFRSERGYEDAVRLIEEFQRAVTDLAVTGRIDAQALSMVTSVLHMAGIEASAELHAGVTHFAENVLPLAVPPDFTDAMADMVAECEGDPFQLAGALAEAGHAIPAEARILMAIEQVRSTNAALREAAILYLLDGEPTLRRAVASELQARAASLSPESLRRLIGMRNWCPEKERPALDAIIRAVRAKGIDCAAWPQGGAGTVYASGIDGSGAQGFLIVSPVAQKVQISSVLLKSGVRDAWSAPPASKREVQSTLALAATETSMRPVSRKYFDRILRHHLQVGLAAGILPPAGLLQVAETIGHADWQPELLDWRSALAAMLAELPAAMVTPQAVSDLLHTSADWADFDQIAESWFEDDEHVARVVVADIGGRQGAQSVDRVLAEILAPRREKWAAYFLGTALWLREEPEDSPWRGFVILAQALGSGRDLADISVMRVIAARTVAVLSNAPALRIEPATAGKRRRNRPT